MDYRSRKHRVLTAAISAAVGLMATAAKAEQSAPQQSQPPVTQLAPPPIAKSSSLDEYLSNEGHVLGYKRLKNSQDQEIANTFVDKVNAFMAPGGFNGIDYALLSSAARLPPERLFLSHISVSEGPTQPDGSRNFSLGVTKDDTSAEKVLNRLEAWTHAGEAVQLSGTYVSSQINEVIWGPQNTIKYEKGNVKAPLDLKASPDGDCKSSGLQRYALLRMLAARHEINANPGDVFILEVISTNPGADGHVVAGYFDRSRQALMIFEGTGYGPDASGKISNDSGKLFEDTQNGRKALQGYMTEIGLKLDIKEYTQVLKDFVPLAIYTDQGPYFFDLFDPNSSSSQRPTLKQPIIDVGQTEAIRAFVSRPLAQRPAYAGIYDPKVTP